MRRLKFTIFFVIFALLFLAQLGWVIPLSTAPAESFTGTQDEGPGPGESNTNSVLLGLSTPFLDGSGNGFLSLGQSLFAAESSQYNQIVLSLVVLQFGSAFFLAMVGSQVLARRIEKPLRQVAQQIQHLRSGELDQVIDVDGGSALRVFTDNFNKMLRTITSREKVVSHYAFHDSLTSLPNRNRFVEYFDQQIKEGLASATVTKVTLKGFSDINANLGRDIGDSIIMEVARWLQMVTEPGNLFHFSGSTFVLLDCNMDPGDAENHIRSLTQFMAKEYNFQSISLYIEPQFGVAIYPQHGTSAET